MSDLTKASKFIALVLRHKPEAANVTLDSCGWANVSALLKGMAEAGTALTLEQLEEIVQSDNKGRYVFSEDGNYIRAAQGHSVKVDMGFTPVVPPETLLHGTVDKFLPSIKATGLDKRSRQHVHLSTELVTATNVAERRGSAVILKVRAGDMHRDGFPFFQSENGVWLTDHVPVKYIDFPN